MRKKWLVLPLGAALAALAVVALLVWLGVEDARQAALLEAREREAGERAVQAADREYQLRQGGAPAEEVRQAEQERVLAARDRAAARYARAEEKKRHEQTWHARLRQEVRRRTGW